MTSIKQNLPGRRLPDFRNLGVMLRMLLGANLLALMAALVQVSDLANWLPRYVELAIWVEPLLLCSLLVLAFCRDLLWRFPYAVAVVLAVIMVVVQSVLLADFWIFMGFMEGGWSVVLRVGLLGAVAAVFMIAYFHLRDSALSPALSEARLQALTARIRPHFLFNSLNAVLSLIRSEPKRAEHALEELAELFRALMRDNRELVPLADELALCRQYLDLEKLRLGERLQVVWDIEEMPGGDIHVPLLILQPLLENAVYHGIEPSNVPGEIRVHFTRQGTMLQIDLSNSVAAGSRHHAGNQMALANIRERLALHYDLEARLEASEKEGVYRVKMVLPCKS